MMGGVSACAAVLLFPPAAAALQVLAVQPSMRGALLRPAALRMEGEGDEVGEWGLDGLVGLMDDAEEYREPCWHIDCKSMTGDGEKELADVLQQAQKQGNWLRGLEGTVQVTSAEKIEILVQGEEKRLESFAAWAKSALSGAAVEVKVVSDDDYCSMRPVSRDFALVGEGPAFEAWKELLKPLQNENDVMAGWSEEAQF